MGGFVGYLIGGVLIPMLSTRHSQRMAEQSGLTMSQVLDLIVLASESGIAVVDQFHDVVLFNPRAEELGLVRNRLVDDRAWVAALRVLETGEPVEVDLSAKAPSGDVTGSLCGVPHGCSARKTTNSWSCSPTTIPNRCGWRRPAATSSPTSATN